MFRKLIRSGIVAGVVALTGVTAPPAHATSPLSCTYNASYGTQCEKVVGSGRNVSDVVVYYVPPTGGYLQGRTWRLLLTDYNCDPRGKSKGSCPPITHGSYKGYPGKTKTVPPVHQGTTCDSISFVGTYASAEHQDCIDWGLADQYARLGDFPAFGTSHSYSSDVWLCAELQIVVNGTWTDNAGGNGLRACNQVHL